MTSFILEKETLELLPEKAIYWPKYKRVLLSDLHIGKVMHFRKNGIAIPPSIIGKNLETLSYVLLNYEIDEVYFLGDLFHSQVNAEWSLFMDFLQKFEKVEWHLIIGNHDEMNTNFFEKAGIKLHYHLDLGPFSLTHHPEKTPLYNLCGHLHPGIRLSGKGRQNVRLPCYYFGERQGVLPAFGAFTGLSMIRTTQKDRVFAIIEDQVIQVKKGD